MKNWWIVLGLISAVSVYADEAPAPSATPEPTASAAPAAQATPAPTPNPELVKLCGVLENDKRASYEKFLKAKIAFEKNNPKRLNNIAKRVATYLARDQRLLEQEKKLLNQGMDVKTGTVSELVQMLRATAHPEWFAGVSDPKAYSGFLDDTAQRVSDLEQRIQVDASYQQYATDPQTQAPIPVRGEGADMKFYPGSSKLVLDGCSLDLSAKLSPDRDSSSKDDWGKLGDGGQPQPICAVVVIEPMTDAFDPASIDVKAAVAQALETTVGKIGAIKAIPDYYGSVDAYLDHELPSACRPNKKTAKAPVLSTVPNGEDLLKE